MVDAIGYVRARRELSLVAMTTIGVVVIGFPYLIFLPALADERFDVGAGGYGVMAGVAGLGGRHRRSDRAPSAVGRSAGRGGSSASPAPCSERHWSPSACRCGTGRPCSSCCWWGRRGWCSRRRPRRSMLSLSDFQYHGRMQSMVVLGFSGFGLAALPAGPLRRRDVATAHARRDGRARARRQRNVRLHPPPPPPPAPRRRAGVSERSGAPMALRRSSRRRGRWRPSARRSGRSRCAGRAATSRPSARRSRG